MPQQTKPHINHVRTGCVTCKRRKVKCSEERPRCSRCLRGGFVCLGYAVPKAWVFERSIEAQASTETGRLSPRASKDFRLTESRVPGNHSRSNIMKSLPTFVNSPLQLGNSDPFNSYAIPIGPRETHLLEIYQELFMSPLCGLNPGAPVHLAIFYSNCLRDEAAAHALFARNSALASLALRGHCANSLPPFIGYLNRSYAVLRHKLSLMDGSETAPVLRPLIATTFLLANAAILVGSIAVEAHLRATSKLLLRYQELTDVRLEIEPALNLVYTDTSKACTTLSYPKIDADRWLPGLFQDVWDSRSVSGPHARASDSEPVVIHPDLQDKVLADIVRKWRERRRKYHIVVQEAGFNLEKARIHKTGELCREVFQTRSLLNVLLDALEQLESSTKNSEDMQHQSVRAYISVSLLLWIHITSPVAISLDALFDVTTSLLRHIKGLMEEDIMARNSRPFLKHAYVNARLWALFIVIHTKLHKQGALGSWYFDDEWLLHTFRTEAEVMQVHSWQQAVLIFRQFLFDDEMEPHISQWWHQVVPRHGLK